MTVDDPLLPLAKVAEAASVTEAEVRAWIRDGELAAEAAGDNLMVRTSVLDAASYEGGMRVRTALNKARLRRFQAKQAGKVEVAPRAREVWRPAESMVPQAAIAELRAQLERLWFPAPAQANRATSETEWPIVATFAAPNSVVEPYPLADGLRRAEALEALQRSMDERVRQELVLRSDAGYSAEAVAELLYAFGFVNAEASSWAWRNGEGCLGDDYILSASHDVPEEICLWFNVARVAHPQAVARVAIASRARCKAHWAANSPRAIARERSTGTVGWPRSRTSKRRCARRASSAGGMR